MSVIGKKLAAFRPTVEGKFHVGDTAVNRGQCVGLVEVWIDYLHLPHIWGNALDLLNNAPEPPYRVIKNKPTNFPLPGDIVVWDGTWGGGYGHTAIAVTAHVMSFTALAQNDPLGSPPHIVLYTYTGVIGWIRPEVAL